MDDLLLDAIDIARNAGRTIRPYFRSDRLDIHSKLNEADIVTAADKASEAIIVKSIKHLYPSHSILSEEMGAENHDSEYRWVIDPLDGTTNFSAGIPVFAVSIGIEHNGTPIVGVVYDPVLDELFTAVKGQGAFLNGTPIHVKENNRLDRAVVSTGFPVDKDVNPDNNLDNVARVLPLVRGMRRLGSAAMDICYVAAGFTDAYWEMNLHEWDVAAALLILDEAGGESYRFRDNRNISVIASDRNLMRQLKELIR
ncbi:MAG: inositol monophosphatase [Duncaniella sp.]|nr:inositol monophosphatase [Duncaniella sp.]